MQGIGMGGARVAPSRGPAVTEKDEEPDPNLRVIEVMKSNYGPVGETINLRWENGVCVPVTSVKLDRLAAEQEADDLFLELVPGELLGDNLLDLLMALDARRGGFGAAGLGAHQEP